MMLELDGFLQELQAGAQGFQSIKTIVGDIMDLKSRFTAGKKISAEDQDNFEKLINELDKSLMAYELEQSKLQVELYRSREELGLIKKFSEYEDVTTPGGDVVCVQKTEYVKDDKPKFICPNCRYNKNELQFLQQRHSSLKQCPGCDAFFEFKEQKTKKIAFK